MGAKRAKEKILERKQVRKNDVHRQRREHKGQPDMYNLTFKTSCNGATRVLSFHLRDEPACDDVKTIWYISLQAQLTYMPVGISGICFASRPIGDFPHVTCNLASPTPPTHT